MAVGWYILYQGMVKFYDPSWSAEGYLLNSQWIFSGIFNWMAESEGILKAVDFINIYGQMAIGLGLILGLFTRFATLGGIILLSLIYLAHPPLAQFATADPEVVVNGLLVQIISLLVLYVFPTGKIIGLDRLLEKKPAEKRKAAIA